MNVVTDRDRLKFLAENVRRKMNLLGWNQEKLETESGVSQATISRLLAGKHNLASCSLWNIATALGTSMDLLMAEPAKKIFQNSP